MRRVGIGLLCAVGGFILGALLTGLLIAQVSSNTHDLGVETAMTAIFAGGPLGAVVGFLGGFIWARPKPKT
ncbi:MAG: hypothetical protein ABMA15_21085 [Vicinamibacterales bacterium]